jgi:site-specific DNA-methyltransferase (adenine-specific)
MPQKCDLYNLDCLEFLKKIPDNSVDLVLTDPPYLISRKTGFLASKGEKTIERFKMSYEFGEWDEKQLDLKSILSEIHRILKPTGTSIIFYDLWKIQELKEEYEANKFKQIRFLEWVKTNPVPINSKINYLTNAREVAVLAIKKSKPTFNSEYDNGIYSYPIYHGKDRFHPTQKSVDLFSDLVKKHSNIGDIVCDPFAGSSTTAISCIRNERSFIGTEISEEYYQKSLERINNEKNRTK